MRNNFLNAQLNFNPELSRIAAELAAVARRLLALGDSGSAPTPPSTTRRIGNKPGTTTPGPTYVPKERFR